MKIKDITLQDLIQKIISNSKISSILSSVVLIGLFYYFIFLPSQQSQKDYCDSQIKIVSGQIEEIKKAQSDSANDSKQLNQSLSNLMGKVDIVSELIRQMETK